MDRAIGLYAIGIGSNRPGRHGRPADTVAAAIARLTPQKGLDLVPDVIDEIIQAGGKLVILGSGESGIGASSAFAPRRRATQRSAAMRRRWPPSA